MHFWKGLKESPLQMLHWWVVVGIRIRQGKNRT
jgi:hypothetical protein